MTAPGHAPFARHRFASILAARADLSRGLFERHHPVAAVHVGPNGVLDRGWEDDPPFHGGGVEAIGHVPPVLHGELAHRVAQAPLYLGAVHQLPRLLLW